VAGVLRSMRDAAAPVPLWERHPEKAFWYDYDPAAKLLYVGYNEVTDTPQQTARAFFESVFAFARAHPIERCVVDLRSNGGGNGFLNKPLIVELIRSPELDRDGVLFAAIGRSTFSAAQMAVSDLERWTNVTIAGEPGGSKPNHYGEGRRTALPGSGLMLSISTLYWQTSSAFDTRDAVKPAIDAELSSADERAGVDPVLAAIARYVPLRTALAPELRAADPEGIARVVRRYAGDPAYRYANFENAINRYGYEELGAERMPNAIALFRANTHAYPASWNTFDSLGEALLKAARMPEAIVAYRRALELAPETAKLRIRAILAKLGG
jgi:tetratricopeptide (TPR) repeat protein